MLLILASATLIVVCFWLQKRKNRRAYFAPTADNNNSIEMPTTINVEYRSSQLPLQRNVVYDTTNVKYYNVPYEQLTGPVSLETNVAYDTTTHDPALTLSTNANVAYVSSDTQQGMNVTEEEHNSENYDYI